MRHVIAVLMLAHAVAHLPGFLVSWQLRAFPEMPFRTTVLGGLLDVGGTGIKFVGVGWFALSLGFAVIAIGALSRAPWWPQAAYIAIGLSTLLCIAGWPDARLGLVANAVLFILIVVSGRVGWL
jgi:hypothetical protein